MNRKILFVLPLSWMLVACEAPTANKELAAPMGDMGGMEQVEVDRPSPMPCTSYSATKNGCSGNSSEPKVTIDLDTKDVDPECIEAKRDKVIVFKLKSKSKIERGSVQIVPKSSSEGWWLAGKNDPNKKRIYVGVPDETEAGAEFPPVIYEYSIYTSDWCIDPRVSVE